MEPVTPQDAQRIVAAYLTVLESHAAEDVYPGSLRDLPHPKETIRMAFAVSTKALIASGQMTGELREYLELAYVSLADYVEDEVVKLMREYARAGQELASDSRAPRDRVATDAWRRIAEQSGLAGRVARAISAEAEELRAEYRSWQQAGAASS